MVFAIGDRVACSDGACGRLSRVVVGPVARALTHLVVEARHRPQGDRLVPVDLVQSTGEDIRLRCSLSEFDALEPAEETRFLPGAPGDWDYSQSQMLSQPYFGLGLGLTLGQGASGIGLGAIGGTQGPHAVTSERIPVGEV